jgi:hypothetical protein
MATCWNFLKVSAVIGHFSVVTIPFLAKNPPHTEVTLKIKTCLTIVGRSSTPNTAKHLFSSLDYLYCM